MTQFEYHWQHANLLKGMDKIYYKKAALLQGQDARDIVIGIADCNTSVRHYDDDQGWVNMMKAIEYGLTEDHLTFYEEDIEFEWMEEETDEIDFISEQEFKDILLAMKEYVAANRAAYDKYISIVKL